MPLPRYEHFKFEVGDFVQPAVSAIQGEQSLRDKIEGCFQIVERVYQECPGGIQLHYLCRPQMRFGDKRHIQFNEIELAELDLPEDSDSDDSTR